MDGAPRQVARTGGGKSLLPMIAAARRIGAGLVDRVCWAVPRDSLRLQAEEAFAGQARLRRGAFVRVRPRATSAGTGRSA